MYWLGKRVIKYTKSMLRASQFSSSLWKALDSLFRTEMTEVPKSLPIEFEMRSSPARLLHWEA